MASPIPSGWAGIMFTPEEAKAKKRASELRKEGKTVRIGRHSTSTLSGRG